MSDADAEYAARLQLEEVGTVAVALTARERGLCRFVLTRAWGCAMPQEFEVATAKVIAERDAKLAVKAQRRLEVEARREAVRSSDSPLWRCVTTGTMRGCAHAQRGSKQVEADAQLARQLQRREIAASKRSVTTKGGESKKTEKGDDSATPEAAAAPPVVVAAAAPES